MLKNLGLVVLASLSSMRVAHADFMVYTEPPIPTSAIPSFSNQADAASWTTSVFLNAGLSWAQFQRSLGAPYSSSRSSAASEIAAFVATAPSNYSIPAAVTDEQQITTFFSAPAWYSALPTAARAFKEQQVADQFSIVRSVIARETSSSSSAGAVPTARAWVGREAGVVAAAMAAAFL